MRLILIRHGQTQWNREQRIQGWLDSPLTVDALLQLQQIALPQLNNPLLFSSDLGRAECSAEIIAQKLNIRVQTDTRLRERNFGVLQGRVINQDKELQLEWAKYHQRYKQQLSDIADVEPEAEFEQRIRAFLGDLSQFPSDSDLLVVGHGEFLRACINVIHGVPSWHYGCGIPANATAVIVQRTLLQPA